VIGRWTDEEQEQFLKALEQHGNDWKNMSSMIPTRTLMQIRTHAQKYFKKQAKVQKKQDGVEVKSESRDPELSQAQAPGAQWHNQLGSAQSSGQSTGSVPQGVMGQVAAGSGIANVGDFLDAVAVGLPGPQNANHMVSTERRDFLFSADASNLLVHAECSPGRHTQTAD
jgi:SHAQKYF class myb-like DNA-binding protein